MIGFLALLLALAFFVALVAGIIFGQWKPMLFVVGVAIGLAVAFS